MATADVQTGRMPDVMQGGRRSQRDPRAARRYSRKTSEDSEPSPRHTNIPPVDHRRGRLDVAKAGGGGGHLRRQHHGPRRASESALLPPIKLSTIRYASPSSPNHDANETTSSPTSHRSCPLGPVVAGLGAADHADSVLSGIQGSSLVPLGAEGSAAAAAASTEREMVRSPLAHKEAQSNRSVAETSDTTRLSPVAATPDLVRLKAERRVLKSVNDVLNDVTSKTPTIPHLEGVGGGGGGGGGAGTPTPKRGKVNRRVSMQSLPKLASEEQPFSVRRKIEQFRKWHEDQFTEKLRNLKVEVEKERRELDSPKAPQAAQFVEIDFAKILEENMKNSKPRPSAKKAGKRKDSKTGNPVPPPASEEQPDEEEGEKGEKGEGETPPPSGKKNKPSRCKSSGTWRTWRDANDSYAYDNVTKYIEENELLPQDRVEWIHSWLGEVHQALGRGSGSLNATDEGRVAKSEVSVDKEAEVCIY